MTAHRLARPVRVGVPRIRDMNERGPFQQKGVDRTWAGLVASTRHECDRLGRRAAQSGCRKALPVIGPEGPEIGVAQPQRLLDSGPSRLGS